MVQDSNTLDIQCRRIRVVIFRLFIFLFLGLFTIAPAMGQMGGTTIYTDAWFDGSGIDNSRAYEEDEVAYGAYMYSRGTTMDYYNSYGHRYYVYTTLTSPTRTTSATSYTSSSSATATVSLSLGITVDGFLDSGDFRGETQHYMSCPYMGGFWFVSGTTFDIILPGLSTTCYDKYDSDFFFDYYRIISDCREKVSCIGPSSGEYPLPGLGNTQRQTVQATWIQAGSGPRFCTGQWLPFNNIFRSCDSNSCRDIPAR